MASPLVDQWPVTAPNGNFRTRVPASAICPLLDVCRPSFVKLKLSAPVPLSVPLWSK